MKKEVVPQYFTIVIPTPTHSYFTADQQNRGYHEFADHNCLFATIDLLNKSLLIKAQSYTLCFICEVNIMSTYVM